MNHILPLRFQLGDDLGVSFPPIWVSPRGAVQMGMDSYPSSKSRRTPPYLPQALKTA